MNEERVPAPDPEGPTRKPLAEAIDEATVRAPTRGNRKLESFLSAVNEDEQVRTWWYMAQVHAERLGMSDHSWVHMQIVLNIALRLLRLLRQGRSRAGRRQLTTGLSARDAEVVVAGGALLHDIGMSIHRNDHEAYSLFLAAGALDRLLADSYREPKRTVVASEILHAIIGHRRRGEPYTVEAGVVRVADALDMAQGRTRIPLEAGREGIHSISAAAVDEVRIEAGEERAGPDRDRAQQLGRDLPGRRPAGDEDPRHAARGAGRSRREDRGGERETPALRVYARVGLTEALEVVLAHFLALLEPALDQRKDDRQERRRRRSRRSRRR